MEISLAKLTELTGKSYRSLKTALKDVEPVKIVKNSHLYESKVALPLIYGIGMGENGPLDSVAERAKLDKARRLGQELKNKEMEGELVSASEVSALWQRMISACRAKLLSIPTKAAPLVMAAETQNEAKDIIKTQVNESLKELHQSMSRIAN